MSLYTSASGKEVSHLSYSAISDYDYCPELFRLSRIEGYRDKDRRAAFEFGTVVETAIQFYHENGLKAGDGIDEFKRLWLKFKEIPLVFTEQEQDWTSLYYVGAHMLRLYEIFLPTLPIKNPKFQLNYKKPLWPGTNLADLEFTSFIDLLSTLDDGRRIIVDIKTAKAPLDGTDNMVSLDPQLKDYAWATGIRDVAFLWFVKAKLNYRRGDSVTLLEDAFRWNAGQELEVFKFVEASESDPMTPAKVIVGMSATIQLMEETLDQIKGKGSTEAKSQVVAEYLADERLVIIPTESVTKVRLQWISGIIPEKELPETGQHIGNKMIQIKTAVKDNFFPKTGGVRYPNMKCPNCRMRGLCLNRQDLVDKLLVKIGPKVEDDWLKDLEQGDEE